jgi:hypothetical protein
MKKFIVFLMASGALFASAVVASATTCRIVDAKGEPISGARVSAWPLYPAQRMRSFVTDENGDLSLPVSAWDEMFWKLRLTDPWGKTLAGATVCMPRPYAQIARGVTDAKGEFHFVLKSAPRPSKGFYGVRAVDSAGKAAADARLSPPDLNIGGYVLDAKGELDFGSEPDSLNKWTQVAVAADGYVYASATVPSSSAKAAVIRLSRETPIRLIVTDENGKPVGGARAVLQRARFESGKTSIHTYGDGWSAPNLAEAKTAGDGTFTLHHLPALKSCKTLDMDVEVSRAGYATIVRSFYLTSPAKLSSIVLPRLESAIEGTAYLPGKSGPLPQGTLLQVGVGSDVGFISSQTVAVDKDGKFRVPALAAGKVGINPLPLPTNADRGWMLPINEPIELKSREVKTVEVVAIKGALLQGTVLKEATGKPMPNIVVTVSRSHWSDSVVLTDALGRFHIRVAPGDVKLEAALMQGIETAEGYSKTVSMKLADGDVKDNLEIRLGPPASPDANVEMSASDMAIYPGTYPLEWKIPRIAADFDPETARAFAGEDTHTAQLKKMTSDTHKRFIGLRSTNALFGDAGPLLIVVDESKGAGKGYDTAYLIPDKSDQQASDLAKATKVQLRGNQARSGGLHLSMLSKPGEITTEICIGEAGRQVSKSAALDGLSIYKLRVAPGGLEAEIVLRGGWYGEIKTDGRGIPLQAGDDNGNGVYGDKLQPGWEDSWERCGDCIYLGLPGAEGGWPSVPLARAAQLCGNLYSIDVSSIGDSLSIKPYEGDTGLLTVEAVDAKGGSSPCDNVSFQGDAGYFGSYGEQPARVPTGSYRCWVFIAKEKSEYGGACGIAVTSAPLVVEKDQTARFKVGGPIHFQITPDAEPIRAKAGIEKEIEMTVYAGDDMVDMLLPGEFVATFYDAKGNRAATQRLENKRSLVHPVWRFKVPKSLKQGSYTVEVRVDAKPYQEPVSVKKKLIVE